MKIFFKQYLICLFLLVPFFSLYSQNKKAYKWANEIYSRLTLEEKVGQLFMVAAYSNQSSEHRQKIQDLIEKEHIGGLIFFQGDPMAQVELTNFYGSKSRLPLFISIDAEWGLGMRLKNTYRFPFALTLGATFDKSLSCKLGKKIAAHCKRIGVHINFAPVLDVNLEPKNPIISMRAFGSDPMQVSKHGIAYAKGLQEKGILAVGKHFPGHGNTKIDSHKSLPLISSSKEKLEKEDLLPFKKYIQSNQGKAIMAGHLLVPSLDRKNQNLPASLSSEILENFLRDGRRFGGLIFTDALNMKAVKDNYFNAPGEIELNAFMAGNDVLVFAENVKEGKKKILTAIKEGKISLFRLKESVIRILVAKYEAGLTRYKKIDTKNLLEDLNDKESHLLHEKILTRAITIAKNESNQLPLKSKVSKYAYIAFGGGSYEDFYEGLKNHAQTLDKIEVNSLEEVSKLESYEKVIIGVHPSKNLSFNKTYQFSDFEKNLLRAIVSKHSLILNLFANPYSLLNLDEEFKNSLKSLIISYENTPYAQQITSKIIFGKRKAYGKLPIDLNF